MPSVLLVVYITFLRVLYYSDPFLRVIDTESRTETKYMVENPSTLTKLHVKNPYLTILDSLSSCWKCSADPGTPFGSHSSRLFCSVLSLMYQVAYPVSEYGAPCAYTRRSELVPCYSTSPKASSIEKRETITTGCSNTQGRHSTKSTGKVASERPNIPENFIVNYGEVYRHKVIFTHKRKAESCPPTTKKLLPMNQVTSLVTEW